MGFAAKQYEGEVGGVVVATGTGQAKVKKLTQQITQQIATETGEQTGWKLTVVAGEKRFFVCALIERPAAK